MNSDEKANRVFIFLVLAILVAILLLTKCTSPMEPTGCVEPLKKVSVNYSCKSLHFGETKDYQLSYNSNGVEGYLFKSFGLLYKELLIDTVDILITSDSSFLYNIPLSEKEYFNGFYGDVELYCNEKNLNYIPLATGITKHEERKPQSNICN